MTFYEIKSKIQPKLVMADYAGISTEFGQYPRGVTLTESGVDYSYNEETLLDILYKSPEVNAIFNKIIHDILADGGRINGKNKRLVKEVQDDTISKQWFWRFLEGCLKSFLRHGIAYGQIVGVDKRRIDAIMQKHIDSTQLRYYSETKAKEKLMSGMYSQIKSVITPKIIDLPADKMRINFNKHGMFDDPSKAYIQIPTNASNTENIYFNESEILTFEWNRIDGRVYPEPPLNCCIKDINTILLAKDYQEDFFRNNGTPPFIFVLKNATRGADDPNYSVLKQALSELKKSGNKHRNLMLTGEIDVNALNDKSKDIDLSSIINHYVSIISWLFGIQIVSGKNSTGDMRVYDDRYYKNIDFFQKCFEIPLNEKFFKMFGPVTFSFKRKYMIDEVREAQIFQMTTGNSILPLMTLSEARERFGLSFEEDEIPQELKDVWDKKFESLSSDVEQTSPWRESDESSQSIGQKEGGKPNNSDKLANKMTSKKQSFINKDSTTKVRK